MKGVLFVACFLLLCAGCTTFASLPRPVFLYMSSPGGNCTGTTAVDSRGRIWTESGCEERSSGVRYRWQLTPEKKERFDAALAVLRQLPEGGILKACTGPMAAFSILDADGTRREWDVCAPEEGQGWPTQFAEILAAME